MGPPPPPPPLLGSLDMEGRPSATATREAGAASGPVRLDVGADVSYH
jgi:hypothetical protein